MYDFFSPFAFLSCEKKNMRKKKKVFKDERSNTHFFSLHCIRQDKFKRGKLTLAIFDVRFYRKINFQCKRIFLQRAIGEDIIHFT